MADEQKLGELAVPLPKAAIEDGLRAEGIDPNAAPSTVTEHKAEVECPKCGHKFWHKVKEALKGAAENLGDAIGEAKFGG